MLDQPTFLPPTRIGPITRLKWRLFRLLEKLSSGSGGTVQGMPSGAVRDALWIFVSTIGELNAIGPFLKQLSAEHSDLKLVLISDRSIYRASYLAQYPHAEVVEIGADNIAAFALGRVRPPRLFVIAEIPCLPSDAPCRLPFGYILAAKRAGAIVALVNGWLYHYVPACRMDSIERTLLGRDSLRLIDVLCVQNEEVAQALISIGADAARVHITGNIKFDAMDTTPRPLAQTRSPQLLASLAQGTRPVIVAGCVTDDEERDLVLDAFDILKKNHSSALLVLAPRHPENDEVMKKLIAAVSSRHAHWCLHSSDGDVPLPNTNAVLILDTMGELRDFYAVANVAHVGRDHNLLEPLAYGKPVTARPNWNTTFPSFPVLSLLQRHSVLPTTASPTELSNIWSSLLSSSTNVKELSRIAQAIETESGAGIRCLNAIKQNASSMSFNTQRDTA
ncbi:MAG TPA: glycosyltransferase N-terminal domain-containing protein [Rhodocyclaceae bacterium]|nr:glycosyltransferase N-terminal domain-containing protein [Rhodocyclaceae bacterium]